MKDQVPSSDPDVRDAQLNRQMRAAALVAILGLVSLLATAEEGAVSRYQAALKHISEINAPTRTIDIEIQASSGSGHRKQSIKVRGELSAANVKELVQLNLASKKGYFLNKNVWLVEVTGDSQFASVLSDNQCLDFCRYSTSAAYSFDGGKWTLIYESVMVS